MTTICYRRATRTSRSVSTSYTVGATYRNVVHTSPARTYLVPAYTSLSCTTRSTSRVCSTRTSSRLSVSPARPYTTQVLIHTQRTIYITNVATLYSTSCTVSRRPTPAPTPPPVTTYITIGTTTTQTSVFYPSQTTVDSTSGGDPSVIDVPSDFPVTVDGGVSTGPKKAPIGAIVGGVLGGLVAAVLLGFLAYYLVLRKSKKSYAQDNSREHLEHQRVLSVDGHSSPSDGSSGVLPQMQEYGVRNSYVSSGPGMPTLVERHILPGHQYAHVRQDSMGMALPVAGVEQISPLSSPGLGTEQGQHYPRGQYVGHAEIQDSRF